MKPIPHSQPLNYSICREHFTRNAQFHSFNGTLDEEDNKTDVSWCPLEMNEIKCNLFLYLSASQQMTHLMGNRVHLLIVQSKVLMAPLVNKRDSNLMIIMRKKEVRLKC